MQTKPLYHTKGTSPCTGIAAHHNDKQDFTRGLLGGNLVYSNGMMAPVNNGNILCSSCYQPVTQEDLSYAD